MQSSPAASAPAPAFSAGYKATVLSVLLAAYTFNFIDRTIIGIIGQAIKTDLHLTDTQLGLLGGLSFAVLYTFMGIPIARLAERHNRVTIISVSLVVWSAFTALCGFAQNFLQLFLMRVGVGVGEAGCSPPAHSLISDYYAPSQRASALSVYSFGIPLGTMIGAVAGGWLTDTFDWRTALMVVGLPGIALAVLTKLVVKEPPRGMNDPVTASPSAGATPSSDVSELRVIAAKLFGRWPSLNVILGMTLTSIATYGSTTFSAPFFIRAFGLSYTQVGFVTGIVMGLSAGAGTLLGGVLADRAGRRHVRWYALVPAIGLAIAGPLYILAYMQDSWQAVAGILLIPGVFAYTCLGPTYAVIQNVVEPHQRATAAALFLFFINFIALGFGPVLTGWLIDMFTQSNLAGLVGACPGGAAPAGAPAALAQRCASALAEGTRLGIIVTLGAHIWAAFHYYLASRGLASQLAHLNPRAAESA